MMAATADSLPLDAKGFPISLSLVKELLADDVSLIRDAVAAVDADQAAVDRGIRCYANPMLRRIVEYLEQAHDLHWDWYRSASDAAAARA